MADEVGAETPVLARETVRETSGTCCWARARQLKLARSVARSADDMRVRGSGCRRRLRLGRRVEVDGGSIVGQTMAGRDEGMMQGQVAQQRESLGQRTARGCTSSAVRSPRPRAWASGAASVPGAGFVVVTFGGDSVWRRLHRR